MGLDYYAILNVPRDAPMHEISLAYRKLATTIHPNRKPYPMHPENPPEGCQDTITHLPRIPNDLCWQYLNEAYDVLINPLHREVFDRFGEEGLKRGTPAPMGYVQPYVYHGDYMRTYQNALGSTSPYADLVDAVAYPPPLYNVEGAVGVMTKDPPIIFSLVLDLRDVFFGGEKKKKIYRHEFTDHTRMQTELREHVLSIPIRPGIRTGCEITFFGEGDRGPVKRPADIVFIVEDRKDPTFRREGSDLHWDYDISLEKSLCGFVVELNTVDDRRLLIPIADVVIPDFVKCIPDEGLPTEEDPSNKGNLYIHFKVSFPSDLSKACKEAIARVLQTCDNDKS